MATKELQSPNGDDAPFGLKYGGIDADKFVSKLKSKLTGQTASGQSFFDWGTLGTEAGVCFNSFPSRVTFYGGLLKKEVEQQGTFTGQAIDKDNDLENRQPTLGGAKQEEDTVASVARTRRTSHHQRH